MATGLRVWRIVLIVVGSLAAILAVLAVVTALRNRSLPSRSLVTDRLAPLEKARIAESIHLRRALGSRWPRAREGRTEGRE